MTAKWKLRKPPTLLRSTSEIRKTLCSAIFSNPLSSLRTNDMGSLLAHTSTAATSSLETYFFMLSATNGCPKTKRTNYLKSRPNSRPLRWEQDLNSPRCKASGSLVGSNAAIAILFRTQPAVFANTFRNTMKDKLLGQTSNSSRRHEMTRLRWVCASFHVYFFFFFWSKQSDFHFGYCLGCGPRNLSDSTQALKNQEE